MWCSNFLTYGEEEINYRQPIGRGCGVRVGPFTLGVCKCTNYILIVI